MMVMAGIAFLLLLLLFLCSDVVGVLCAVPCCCLGRVVSSSSLIRGHPSLVATRPLNTSQTIFRR